MIDSNKEKDDQIAQLQKTLYGKDKELQDGLKDLKKQIEDLKNEKKDVLALS